MLKGLKSALLEVLLMLIATHILRKVSRKSQERKGFRGLGRGISTVFQSGKITNFRKLRGKKTKRCKCQRKSECALSRTRPTKRERRRNTGWQRKRGNAWKR